MVFYHSISTEMVMHPDSSVAEAGRAGMMAAGLVPSLPSSPVPHPSPVRRVCPLGTTPTQACGGC